MFTGLATLLLIGLGLAAATPLRVPGALLMLLSVLTGIGWFLYRARRADSEIPPIRYEASTIIWKPYRFAPAQISIAFLQQLAARGSRTAPGSSRRALADRLGSAPDLLSASRIVRCRTRSCNQR